MNDAAKRPTDQVLVVGDVTLDWLEETIPRTERGGDKLRNYELYNPGFQWNAVWGGAALLHRLTGAALKELQRPSKIPRTPGSRKAGAVDVVKIKWPDVESREARGYVASLALIKPTPSDDAKERKSNDQIPIRVERFLGFSGPMVNDPKGPPPPPAVMRVPSPQDVGNLACLVIDDAANGCRWTEEFVGGVRAHAAHSACVIVKLSRPLHKNPMLDELLNTNKDKLVVIMGVDDLRAEGIDISRRLSWERTASDLLSAIGEGEILGKLTGVRALIIRLGSDGCVVLTAKARHLVFDPQGAEDDFDHKLNGTMPGSTSAFVAAVAARLALGETQLTDIIRHGLAASRSLLTTGFVEKEPLDAANADADASSRKSSSRGLLHCPDYPRDVFTDKQKQADVFRVKTLPMDRTASDFNILTERLQEAEALPEKIVRIGASALAEIPTAQYGGLLLVDRREVEGYRSIENLLREYIKMCGLGQQKPLSIGVFGPPGSGKSFGIKELAKHVNAKRIKTQTFNLTQMQKPSDLVGAFHLARDEMLRGHLPLLIFDEFDCSFDGRWGWLKHFLAPMQDATFKDKELVHPLGSAIFVFAGGTADNYGEFNLRSAKLKNSETRNSGESPVHASAEKEADDSRETEAKLSEFKAAKGPDFVSRLRGYVDVQGISGIEGDSACVVRRAVLLRSLLERDERTANLFRTIGKDKELQIDTPVLRAFLNVNSYHHGARSLEAILGMSRLTGADRFAAASLPSNEQLMLHVDMSFVDTLKNASERTATSA